jgi:hypothetical protein
MKDRTALAEVLGVFAAILLYIWWLRWRVPWFWLAPLAFVIATHIRRRESPQMLGFGRGGLVPAARAVVPAALLLSAAVVGLGAALGTLRAKQPGAAAQDILAYFAWGLFQQYLLNGFFANRLTECAGGREPLAAATLFSLAHLPNWFLMPVTFAGGYALVRVYVRHGNLYPLALAHAVVAYALYLAVPDSISAHFLVGPRYILEVYGR